MNELQRYSDFYQTGPYSAVEQTHCEAGSLKINMFMALDRPAGSFREPGVASASLQLAVSGRGPCSLDLGAGRINAGIKPGCWVIGPAEQECHYNLTGDLDLLVFELPIDLMRQLSEHNDACFDFGALHSKLSDDILVENLAKSIWQESQISNQPSTLWIDSALLTLAGRLLTLGDKAVDVFTGGLATWQIRRATEMLESDLGRNITLSDLASEVGLSPFHFSRAFKQSVGVPPHRYRTKLRVETACRLLETTDAPITDIAFQVSYESSQALARIFVQEMGITPSQWRRERRR